MVITKNNKFLRDDVELNLELEVEYEYDFPLPDTWDNPGQGLAVYIYDVFIGGNSIMKALTEEVIERIKDILAADFWDRQKDRR